MLIRFTCLITLFFLLSCQKEKPAAGLQDGKSTVVEDLAGDTGASMNDGVDGKEKRDFRLFLFRLSDQKQTWVRTAADSAQYLKTTDWDLAFAGIYNSSIYVNNGSHTGTPGFGGTGVSGVLMVGQPYHNVTEAPADAAFTASSIKVIGQETGTGTGWFTYSSSTHLVQPVKSRTYILKLNSGKYAKLEIINVYKGNPPVVTDLYWPAPYFTFRYFVQADGSRNLKTQ